MTRATAAVLYSTIFILLPLLLPPLVAGCGPRPDAVSFTAVDLTRTLSGAERRPSTGFDVAVHVADGQPRSSIVMPVPARATWSLPLPRHGLFRAFVAVDPAGTPGTAVRFRLGISDNRVYEALADRTVTVERGWTELRADLSAYAGIKWSLFYRPDRIVWRLVLSTDALGPVPTRAMWGSPEILTDPSSAQEYMTRLRVRTPGQGGR
jgi:hypothetical protein